MLFVFITLQKHQSESKRYDFAIDISKNEHIEFILFQLIQKSRVLMIPSEELGLEKMEVEQQQGSFSGEWHESDLIFTHKRHSFRLLNTPNDEQSTQKLLEFMYILKTSLVNMEINDIYTILFSGDNEHLLMLENDKLIGGIAFNCQHEDFAEIKLMAIGPEYRSKGKGAYLMNVFKTLLQSRKIPLIVTNADNGSQGFYLRQNFTTEEYISNANWQAHQQRYFFTTKMQCLVNPNIDYIFLKKNLQTQRQAVNFFLAESYVDYKVYTHTVVPQKSVFWREQQGKKEYFIINPMELQGLVSNGWSWEEYKQQLTTKETQIYRLYASYLATLFQNATTEIRKVPTSIRNSQTFQKKAPMDLLTLSQLIDEGHYEEEEQFWKDLLRSLQYSRHFYKKNEKINLNLLQLQQIARSLRHKPK